MARRATKPAVTPSVPVSGPWTLPEGWRWERLGDVTDLSSQKVLPNPKSGLLFVGLDAIEPHTMKIGTATPFSEMRSAANQFEEGDVLYGRLRPYLNKVAVAKSNGACSGELLVLRPRDNTLSRYLAFALHERRYLDFAVHAVSGDRPRIGFDAMATFPLPVPPVDTQRRIVERIDELFTELDDGDEALARAQEDLGVWRKTLQKAAVTGELTADWRAANPPTETGAELLARILADRRASANVRLRRDKEIEEPTDEQKRSIWRVPEGWTLVPLGWLTNLQGGFAFLSSAYVAEGVPLIRIGDIRQGRVGTSGSVRLPLESLAQNPSFVVRKGDILIAMSGATTAKFGSYDGDGPALLNQRVGRFVFLSRDLLDPQFLSLWLGMMQERILDAAYGGAQPNISSKAIEGMYLLLPPLDEQREISLRVQSALRHRGQRVSTV